MCEGPGQTTTSSLTVEKTGIRHQHFMLAAWRQLNGSLPAFRRAVVCFLTQTWRNTFIFHLDFYGRRWAVVKKWAATYISASPATEKTVGCLGFGAFLEVEFSLFRLYSLKKTNSCKMSWRCLSSVWGWVPCSWPFACEDWSALLTSQPPLSILTAVRALESCAQMTWLLLWRDGLLFMGIAVATLNSIL